jgi:hypothetical protein
MNEPTRDDRLMAYAIRTENGTRIWQAENAEHAAEQHEDAFGGHEGEEILAIEPPTVPDSGLTDPEDFRIENVPGWDDEGDDTIGMVPPKF